MAGDSKGKALTKSLKSMFGALQKRPVPDRLRSVVDQLDEQTAPAAGGSEKKSA